MRIYPSLTVDAEFASLGASGFTGTLNDRQFAFLRNAGLTGSLPDMLKAYFDNPYADALAAYDVTKANSYVLTSGAVSTLTDLGPNGYSLTQTSAVDRPTIGTMSDSSTAMVFTSTEEWVYTDSATLAQLVNNATTSDFVMTTTFELSTLGAAQVLCSWTNPASNTDECYIGLSTTNKLRIYREVLTTTSQAIDSTTVPFTATNTPYTVTVSANGGVVNAWVNGVQVISSQTWNVTVPTISASRFVIGSRDQTSDTFGFEGKMNSLVIRRN